MAMAAVCSTLDGLQQKYPTSYEAVSFTSLVLRRKGLYNKHFTLVRLNCT